jgi:hypothetical protein
VFVQPTCSALTGQVDGNILDSLDGFNALKTTIDTVRKFWMNEQEVHAIVGPPCMNGKCNASAITTPATGMLIDGGLATVANWPIVSYFSVAYQVETERDTTYNTMSRVGFFNTQQCTLITCAK